MDVKKLVAHRGDNTNYPENSYAGIESALMAGARYVEFDIQMNADETLIVFHDGDFKRMANHDASIFETSDQAMKEISIHEPDQFGEKHYPTHVAHLSEVLTLFEHYPNALALVEVKRESLEFLGLEKFMRKLLALLKKSSAQTMVISFSDKALKYTQQHSELKTGFVFKQYNDANQRIANALKPDYMICPYHIIPKSKLWKGKWLWMLYTINGVVLAEQLFERGDIGFIETDDIHLLLNAKN